MRCQFREFHYAFNTFHDTFHNTFHNTFLEISCRILRNYVFINKQIRSFQDKNALEPGRVRLVALFSVIGVLLIVVLACVLTSVCAIDHIMDSEARVDELSAGIENSQGVSQYAI